MEATRWWEKSLWLAVQISGPAHKKRHGNREGKPPKPVAVVFMITHIIFLLCLFTSAIWNFLSGISVISSFISEGGFKKCFLVTTTVCVSVERDLAWRRTYQPVGHQLLSLRANNATFWLDSGGQNSTKQPIFVTACSLLSVWCVRAWSTRYDCSRGTELGWEAQLNCCVYKLQRTMLGTLP